MSSPLNRSSKALSVVVIGGLTLLRVAVGLVMGPIPQETYYWNYARHLDLSYFDHPPMVGYLIYAFTLLLGNNGFALHAPAIAISCLLSIAVYVVFKHLFDKRLALWAVIICSAVPLFAIGALVSTPDVPLLLFWFLAIVSLERAVQTRLPLWWIVFGITWGAALLSKYTAVMIGPGALLYLLSSSRRRRFLLKPWPYVATTIALLCFSPVVIWNWQNGWVSFLFQSSQRATQATMIRLDYFFGFLGTQLLMTGIFFLFFWVWAIYRSLLRFSSDERQALFLAFALPLPALFLPLSLFTYVKMNWLAPAYLAGVPLILLHYFAATSRRLRVLGSVAIVFLVTLACVLHILVLSPNASLGRAEPIKGWKELAQRVDQLRAEMALANRVFVCGYEYKVASELSFHLDGQPEVLSNNVVGRHGLAFDYWSKPETLVGQDCIFVYDGRHRYPTPESLSVFFARVVGPETLTVKIGGLKITDYYIYRGYNYRGRQ